MTEAHGVEPQRTTGPDIRSGNSGADRAVRRLARAVLGRRGRVDRLHRLAALQHGWSPTGDEALGELGVTATLVDKVARHAYRVTDEDIALAREAGWSDDALFELVVATAVGAGLGRRAVGRSVIARWEAAQ